MKSTKWVFISVLVLGSLALGACGGSTSANSDAVLTEAAQIAFQALTETAEAAPPTATFTPVPPTPTFTPEPPTPTETPEGGVPTLPPQPQQPQQPQGGSTPCMRANLEWESHPDGTEIYANIPFTKTWRLKNTGSCTWDADFVAFWVEGELFGAESVVAFTDEDIPPGGYAMVEVSMRAPDRSGLYRGYWMLRGDGVIFGTGNNAREWFWVDLKVLPVRDEE